MVKKYVIILTLFVIFSCKFSSYVKADELQNIEENIAIESKENVLEIIKKCKEELKQELTKIDEKIDSIKKKQEYVNYPAIRLNVDTPIFGLTSVCNYKLKITSEVSTADVASGYSIKDIIKNNSLKVPSFSVGNIIVITRDIKFDGEITLLDANTSILKLMQYIEQTQSVNEFLDKQIIKIYSEYIPEEKKEKIETLKARMEELENGLDELDVELTKMYISTNTKEEYNEYLTQYLEINKNIYEYTDAIKNVLISDEVLLEYEKKVVELETKYINLKQNVLSTNKIIIEKVDFEQVFENLRNDLSTRKENVENYISNSVKKQQIVQESEELSNEDIIEEVSNEENTIEVAEEEIKIYDVTSNKILTNLGKSIENLDKKILENLGNSILNKIKKIEIQETSEEVVNKDEVNSLVTKELSIDEKNKLLNDLVDLYNYFLKNENQFYLDNINLLLSDTTNKISSLSKYTDYSTIADIRYIYMELPNLLENDTEVYNMKLNVELESLIKSFNEKLEKLVSININITKVYNEKISEEMKNTSRENN